jgi:hypothetical protein
VLVIQFLNHSVRKVFPAAFCNGSLYLSAADRQNSIEKQDTLLRPVQVAMLKLQCQHHPWPHERHSAYDVGAFTPLRTENASPCPGRGTDLAHNHDLDLVKGQRFKALNISSEVGKSGSASSLLKESDALKGKDPMVLDNKASFQLVSVRLDTSSDADISRCCHHRRTDSVGRSFWLADGGSRCSTLRSWHEQLFVRIPNGSSVRTIGLLWTGFTASTVPGRSVNCK